MRLLLSLIIGLLLGIIEGSVRPFLPLWLQAFPVLPMLIIMVMSTRVRWALVAAGSAGLMLDLFALPQSDLAALRYPAIVALMFLVVRHVLTNRSLFVALALALLGRLLERLSAFAVGSMIVWMSGSPYDWAQQALWWETPLWDAAIVAAGFLLLAFLTRRFLTRVDQV